MRTPAGKFLRSTAQALGEVLFPRHCIHTGQPMKTSDPYRYLSAIGAASIEWIERPIQERIYGDFYGEYLARNIHLQLLENRQPFRRLMSLFTLRDAGRSLVHELKYRRGLYVTGDIARLVGDCPPAVEFLKGAVLVPVPLHALRERERGFNQSAQIADALGAALGIGVEPLLVRVRATRTQTQLSREQREQNVEGAFSLARRAVVQAGLRYVVVDDVLTTGATIGECARVLKEGGATQVDAFTLGHG